MNEELLTADVSNKLQELGAFVDNDLPKYIVKLIINQHSIDKIKNELSLFLDSVNTPFIEWLEVYLNNNAQSSNTKTENIEIISASEIEEDILDFEPQDDQLNEMKSEDVNELVNSNETNKRKLDSQSDDEFNKKILNNDKEAVRVNSQNVIKLTNNSHLNDIGLMRRKAMEDQAKEKSKNSQSYTANSPVSNQKSTASQSIEMPDDGFYDLRDKLNSRKKSQEDEQLELEESKTDDEEKKERCRFWPLCKKESGCIFVHPTEQCKQFPSCKSGADKCLYIHPLCKFDLLCTKKDCPFLHIAKKQQQIIIPPPAQPHIMHVQCKFYPNCLNTNCPFIHPKPCMYGSMCKNPVCAFKHPETSSNIAKPHQLKWTKSSSSTNNETSTAMESETNNQLIIKNENSDDHLIDVKNEHDTVLNEIDEAALMQGS